MPASVGSPTPSPPHRQQIADLLKRGVTPIGIYDRCDVIGTVACGSIWKALPTAKPKPIQKILFASSTHTAAEYFGFDLTHGGVCLTVKAARGIGLDTILADVLRNHGPFQGVRLLDVPDWAFIVRHGKMALVMADSIASLSAAIRDDLLGETPGGLDAFLRLDGTCDLALVLANHSRAPGG